MNSLEAIAGELYGLLEQASDAMPDVLNAYRTMALVMSRMLDVGTADAAVTLVGPFAKTDYLLKTHRATARTKAVVNTARANLRAFHTLEVPELNARMGQTLQGVSLLVELVTGLGVPLSLRRLFPQVAGHEHKGQKLGHCVRMIVDRFDGEFVLGELEGVAGESHRLSLDRCGKTFAVGQWSYLGELVWSGCQLNLIRPRIEEGIVTADAIILEPDYLVEISTVASCFESYTESPIVALLARIRPQQTTHHILMGNLAGQMLDEQLRQSATPVPYAETAARFFRDYALRLATCDIPPDFHAEAQRQQRHIRKALSQQLPLHTKGLFSAGNMMVEPSFFCEMYGMQGRMDLMEIGRMRVVLEQKAGKGGYPERTDGVPRAQEKHYVQMLLYSYLLEDCYRRPSPGADSHWAFLYYSRYEKGLLEPAMRAPELFFRALKIRNGIAAQDFRLVSEGFRQLETLTPEALNTKHLTGKLWQNYVGKQLESLLSPIRQATPLERLYTLRMLRAVATEHLLSKIGNQRKENSGFAAAWLTSEDEKLQAGNIYSGLQMAWSGAEEDELVDSLRLLFTRDESCDTSNFRSGDIVVLYPYKPKEQPDLRRQMVFRCTIAAIDSDGLTLSLRHSQTCRRVFDYYDDCLWAVEHDFFESSYSSLYRGTYSFLSAPKSRRDLLLFQREPRIDDTLTLEADHGSFNHMALRVKQARDFFLIIGPPGTGKTSFGLMSTLREELLSSQESILLLSYTNRAVDEICSKLVESGIGFVRIGSRLSCGEPFRQYLLDAVVDGAANVSQLRSRISAVRVVVGTTASLNSNIEIFQLKHFSLAVIDEASQILEPQLMGLLAAVHGQRPAIDRFVMIGDHKQLPAVVQQTDAQSRVEQRELQQIELTDCRSSLFERLLRRYGDDPRVVYMLSHQGRMHPSIAGFPNLAFYESKLSAVPLAHQLTAEDALLASGSSSLMMPEVFDSRLKFLSVQPQSIAESDKVNIDEAQVIARYVVDVYRSNRSRFDAGQTVGVIVPYRNQIATVRAAIGSYGIAELDAVSIDTVERFQGSQRDYIAYGFTVRYHYQLSFLEGSVFTEGTVPIDRKLNVAMTRARKHLLIVGNAPLLSTLPVYRNLIEYMKQQGNFIA